MTISDFARLDERPSLPGDTVRCQYRALKRIEAEERQAASDAEVAKVAREHNVSEREARRFVNARKRFEQKPAAR